MRLPGWVALPPPEPTATTALVGTWEVIPTAMGNLGLSVSTPETAVQGTREATQLVSPALHPPQLGAEAGHCELGECPLWRLGRGLSVGCQSRHLWLLGKDAMPDASLAGSRTPGCVPSARAALVPMVVPWPPRCCSAPVGKGLPQHCCLVCHSQAHGQRCWDESLPRPCPADGGSWAQGDPSSPWHLPPRAPLLLCFCWLLLCGCSRLGQLCMWGTYDWPPSPAGFHAAAGPCMALGTCDGQVNVTWFG